MMEGLEPEPGVSQGFSILNGCHHPIGIRIGSQGARAEVLRVRCELVSFPLSVFPPPPNNNIFAQRGVALEQKRPEHALGLGWSQHTSQMSKLLLIWHSTNTNNGHPHPFGCCAVSELAPSPPTVHSPLERQASTYCGMVMELEELEQVLHTGQDEPWDSWWKPARPQLVSVYFLHLLPRRKQMCLPSSPS